MTERIELLRAQSVNAEPSLTIERALIETEFYRKNDGKYPVPVMRARNFYNLCAKKKIYIGDNELIVGERGPKPKAVPTFPELNCHSVEDFKVLRSREIQHYTISDREIEKYKKEVIPFWKGRTQRDRIFNHVPESWKSLYEAGVFTEFMEQRAPGHTALDGKMYRMGMKDFKARIEEQLSRLDFLNDPEATDKQDELRAMAISCDALILLGRRHADEARKQIARIEKALAGGPAFKVTPFSGETQEGSPERLRRTLTGAVSRNSRTSSRSARGYLRMLPGHSARPYRCTGSATSARFSSSTAGTP